jgi:hypothetical protein
MKHKDQETRASASAQALFSSPNTLPSSWISLTLFSSACRALLVAYLPIKNQHLRCHYRFQLYRRRQQDRVLIVLLLQQTWGDHCVRPCPRPASLKQSLIETHTFLRLETVFWRRFSYCLTHLNTAALAISVLDPLSYLARGSVDSNTFREGRSGCKTVRPSHSESKTEHHLHTEPTEHPEIPLMRRTARAKLHADWTRHGED